LNMKLTVREMKSEDIALVVDYFLDAEEDFIRGMGAEKSKLPNREDWIKKLQLEVKKAYHDKEFYYIIWLLDDEPVGHSNVNQIHFGDVATMHLHVWNSKKRQSGLGIEFLKLAIPFYFKNLQIEKLICEPYSENIPPNKTLKKFGFDFIRSYATVPGWINFHQTVNRYELTKLKFKQENVFISIKNRFYLILF